MHNEMDWKAALSSEIFREYVKNQTQKNKQPKIDDDLQLDLERLGQLEDEIKSSPKKLAAFRALQQKFISDPDYTSNVKQSFVDAVLMLNLD